MWPFLGVPHPFSETLENLKMTLEMEKWKIEDQLEGNKHLVWTRTLYWRGLREG